MQSENARVSTRRSLKCLCNYCNGYYLNQTLIVLILPRYVIQIKTWFLVGFIFCCECNVEEPICCFSRRVPRGYGSSLV